MLCRVRLRARLLSVGCVGGVYAFCKCRFIPPHQSLTRQLPPKGKPLHPFIFHNRTGEWKFGSLVAFVILLVS